MECDKTIVEINKSIKYLGAQRDGLMDKDEIEMIDKIINLLVDYKVFYENLWDGDLELFPKERRKYGRKD